MLAPAGLKDLVAKAVTQTASLNEQGCKFSTTFFHETTRTLLHVHVSYCEPQHNKTCMACLWQCHFCLVPWAPVLIAPSGMCAIPNRGP
jgi:hypothetical protein